MNYKELSKIFDASHVERFNNLYKKFGDDPKNYIAQLSRCKGEKLNQRLAVWLQKAEELGLEKVVEALKEKFTVYEPKSPDEVISLIETKARKAADLVELDDWLEVISLGRVQFSLLYGGNTYNIELVAGEDKVFPDDIHAYVEGGSPEDEWTSDSPYTLALRVAEHCLGINI